MPDEKYLPDEEGKSDALQETLPLNAEPVRPYVPAQADSKWRCKDCNKPFKSKQGLRGHVENYHPKVQASTSGAVVEDSPAPEPQTEVKTIQPRETARAARRGWTRFLP